MPLYDPNGLADACSRADLNSFCIQAYEEGIDPNAGRIGQVVAAKLAMDHIAAHERALQARHATPARLRSWRASRLAGHGDNVWGVFGAFSRAVQDSYSAATAVDNGQEPEEG